MNHKTNFNETFHQLSLDVPLELINFLIRCGSRWPTQLIKASQHKNGFNSVSFANKELELDVVVADSH